MRARTQSRLLGGPGRGVGSVRRVAGVAVTLALLVSVTIALLGVDADLEPGTVHLLYLLVVVVAAAVGGLVPGLLAAALAFAVVAWFFTAPFHTLAIHSKDAVVELIVFGVVAIIVSAVVELAARDRAAHQRQLAEQTARTRELAAADRVRSALLAAVGHDLRTPLANIKAAAGTLRQPGVTWSAAEADELLAAIEDSGDRLTSLVTNLVDMTRLRADAVAVRLAPVALDEVVARALMRERRSDVDVDVAEDLPPVLADAGLLERIVENLVENAVRFTLDGAKVQVRAELVGVADGAAGSAHGAALLHVVDHGPGIAPERRTEIFTAFRQLGDQGPGSHVGLGLAIVHGFSEAMGISVEPSTTPGGGLTMTLTLPVVAP